MVKIIARVFNVQPKDVRHALEKSETIPKGRGEHPALEVDTERHLIDWIIKNAQNYTAINRTELLHYCGEIFGAAVTPGWVDSFLFPHKLELSEMISSEGITGLFSQSPKSVIDSQIINATIERP
jgi:hypothetical protein